jgi:hypothetical protein
MKVIAKSGSAYLLEIEEGQGRVLDLAQHRLFPPNAIASILARGYWEPFDGDQDPILAKAQSLTDSPPAAPPGATADEPSSAKAR